MLDTFQRYLTIYNLVQQAAGKSSAARIRLLDLGSNGPGFASYNRFDNVEQTNIDIVDTDESIKRRYPKTRFLTYPGDVLPFEDNHFDFVISVDVLEHVPPEKRHAFIQEAIRVSKKNVVFVFPVKSSERWEEVLSSITFHRIRFLQEHIAYGLPREQDVYEAVRPLTNVRLVKETGNLNIWLWIPVKLIASVLNVFIKKNDALIYKYFLSYRRNLSGMVNRGQCYSRTFILEKNQL